MRGSSQLAAVAMVASAARATASPSFRFRGFSEHDRPQNSKLAFDGTMDFACSYDGLRVLGVADPAHPFEPSNIHCPAPEGDIAIWERLPFQSSRSRRRASGA